MLRAGGVFVSISFGQPHFRRPLLLKARYGWDLQVDTVGEAFHYFVYTMTKGSANAPIEDAPAPGSTLKFTPRPRSGSSSSSSSSEDTTGAFLGDLDLDLQ